MDVDLGPTCVDPDDEMWRVYEDGPSLVGSGALTDLALIPSVVEAEGPRATVGLEVEDPPPSVHRWDHR